MYLSKLSHLSDLLANFLTKRFAKHPLNPQSCACRILTKMGKKIPQTLDFTRLAGYRGRENRTLGFDLYTPHIYRTLLSLGQILGQIYIACICFIQAAFSTYSTWALFHFSIISFGISG